MSFAQQLLGAWKHAGLPADETRNGPVCICPRCPTASGCILRIEGESVICPVCGWCVTGKPWTIAIEAAKLRPVAQVKGSKLPLLSLEQILEYVPDPRDEIWPGGILSAGDATALVGAPGVGKSRLALQAALATILGWKFLGWETKGEGLRWLFLQTENSTRRLKADLSAMTQHMPERAKVIVNEHLRILNVSALEFGSVCMVDGHPDRARIVATLAEWLPDVVPIDPLRDAGRGDPNKDADMMETCQAIGSVVRAGNARRVPFVIHHGRTGSAEASRVFGDDSASFARNSKVLFGWLRSQINVAAAGVEWPDVIIVGCGKNSNGPKWEPFAAKLAPDTMTYRRLEAGEFDLEQWEEQAGAVNKKKRRIPSPEAVASAVVAAGGEVRGGEKNEEGLVQRVMSEFGVSRADAKTAIEAAQGVTIEATEKPGAVSQGGGKPARIYVLKTDRIYEK